VTHWTLNGDIPQHLYGHVSEEILYGLDPEKRGTFEECVIFGLTSIPSRAWHFSILCQSGAQWARIPLHMLRWQLPEEGAPVHDLPTLQCWDSHGWQFSTVQYSYLREMGCEFRAKDGRMIPAYYWFTADHTDNGYSQFPPEHKCYHFLRLEDGSGQIAAMPNNRIIWRDDSFVKTPETFPRYRVMSPVTWHAEEGRRNPQDTAMTQETERTF
jgi:hypothetical protein